jgi:hypothetical protein
VVIKRQYFYGFGGMRDRIDSILPPRIHFIYRNVFQNTRSEDGEITIPGCILYHLTNVGEFLVIQLSIGRLNVNVAPFPSELFLAHILPP